VLTSTTTLGTDVSKDFFLDLPTERNYVSVAKLTPGAQDDRSGTTFYGSTGAENAYYIDGANTTEIERGVQGVELNFEFIDEVQVKTGAYSAEYGHATGGLVNVITKSGGNEFHGDVFGYYDADSLRAPLSGEAEQGRVSGASKTVGVVRSDYGADLGGYFVRDRLWFFAAYDRVDNSDTNEALYDFGAVNPGAAMVGEEYPWDTTGDLFAFKLTWRPSSSQSLTGSVFGDPTERSGANPNWLYDQPTSYLMSIPTGGTDGALNYDGVFGQNVVLSARFASHNQTWERKGAGRDLTGFFDYTDPFGNGTIPAGWEGVVSGWGGYSEEDFTRGQFNVDVSLFVGDLAGSHELKLGGEYEDLSVIKIRTYSGPVGANVWRYTCDPESRYCGENDEYQYYFGHFYRTAIPIDPEMVEFDDIIRRQAVDTPTQNFAAYLQDQWQLSPNLSLDLGVRWSRQKLYNNGGSVQVDLGPNWSPRLGFVWDVVGNGKSKIFGNWAYFYESIPMDIVIRSFSEGFVYVDVFNFSDDQWDIYPPPPDEEAPRQSRVRDWRGYAPVEPGIQGQYMSEAVIGGQYELSPNYAIGLTFIRRNLERIVEDGLAIDGGYYIGNPGEGLMTHSYDIAAAYGYLCPDGTFDCHLREIPTPERQFTGVELALKKRFSNNFQFIASALWSRLEGNYDGNFQASTGQLDPNINSAYDYADFSVNNDGPLSNDRPWQFKFDGAYRFDFGLTTGLSAYYRSGIPITAMGFCEVYFNWEYYLSERGTFGRTNDEWEADLHLGYPIKLGGSLELNLLVDIFNIFNRQGETGRYPWYDFYEDYEPLDWLTGEVYEPIVPDDLDRPPTHPAWNTSNSWQDPRTIRLGVRLSF
jgi:outer membrane receptor protein involved in Fe transport